MEKAKPVQKRKTPSYIRPKKQYTETETNQIILKYKLPNKYIFYPANFWFHKNHILIINAISLLRLQDIILDVVFTGSIFDGNNPHNCYNELMKLAERLNVSNQIHYLGRIPDEHISLLYKQSIALVMPTFFGPTNIPYLEAFYLDCPVITSNLRGIIDQVGNAAILIDPNCPNDLVNAILQLDNQILKRKLIENGHMILNNWTKTDYSNKMDHLLEFCRLKIIIAD